MRDWEYFEVCHRRFRRCQQLVLRAPKFTQSASPEYPGPKWPKESSYCADFQRAGEIALRRRKNWHGRHGIFLLYYIGDCEFKRAVKLSRLPESTFCRWLNQVRDVVGAELKRRGLHPNEFFKETEKRARMSA